MDNSHPGQSDLKTYFEDFTRREGLSPALARLQAQKLLYQQDLQRGRLSRQQVEAALQELDEVVQSLLQQ